MSATNLPEPDAIRALPDEPHFVTEDEMLRTAATALTITTALGLSACGQSDADDVRHALRGWMRSMGTGDGKRACAMLTDHARRGLADQELVPATCEETIAKVGRIISSTQRRALGRIHVRRVIFAEDHRRAIIEDRDVTLPDELEPDGNDRPMILVRGRDGRWKIEDLG